MGEKMPGTRTKICATCNQPKLMGKKQKNCEPCRIQLRRTRGKLISEAYRDLSSARRRGDIK